MAEDNNIKTISLTVKGLDCAACAEKIEKALTRHEGIHGITVYLGAERADVKFDPSSINEQSIIDTIGGLGYKVLTGKEEVSGKSFHEMFFKGEWTFDLSRIGFVFLLIILSFTGTTKSITSIDLFSIFAVIVGGYPLIRHAFIDLKNRAVTADVFMSMGVVAAAAIGEFRSASIIAFFMLISEFIDSFTMEKSRRAIKDLIDMAPKTARIKRGDAEVEIPVEEVKKGDIAVIKPGEKIPVEGIIISGKGSVNQAPITGESIPVEKKKGDVVYAATLNNLGVLFIKVTHTGQDTTYARIIKLVEEAEASKAPVQRIADKFAAYFTPTILAVAVITFLITWKITNAIAVLVVACPCTVAIATPLAVVASMGRAAKKGIIIKGGRYLEALAKVDTIVMDKTGTVTIGDPVVTDIKGFEGCDEKVIISYAAGVERYSEHPLAKAIIKKASEAEIDIPEPDEYKVVPGMGIEAVLTGRKIMLGSREMLRNSNITLSEDAERYIRDKEEDGKTALLLAHDGVICGVICVADIIREGSIEAIDALKKLGFDEPIMLTGDNPRTANSIASALGIKNVFAQLLPEDKVNKIKELASKGRRVLMIGDGINDAPALAQAHVGIAMGAVGSDAAIEASDVALMRDEWNQIPEAIAIGRNTFSIIKQNLAIGMVFNLVGISLASTGILSPAMAAVAHVMPDVVVFLNSSRLLK
ncbi:MAG: copper-translocating P-type ATPase [Nitrospirae bacterium GWC2_46_6]|nr:MAG: copper-translocating P-type ATPase [Nitrospirae bacterium GWA2_46_11]OGW22945.1 MAG: copper-translocating P-type ATPase [Nitrospirae bacterium GWC2_46_6]OGW23550.1 MAG: copper-translocating P-type ATPase [Nitrospirae bacterium GWB2_47_37]HAK88962.1 ATPase P [Nitrospiraceae bacterium]HCZ11790.1 ATPase P [Nitrospiraceae bacterium]